MTGDTTPAAKTIGLADAIALTHKRMDAGRWGEAEAMARQVLKVAPMNFPALRALGAILEHTGRTDEALQAFESIIEVNPGSGIAFTRRAAILLRRQWGPPPQPRAAVAGPRIMCSSLGANGRFANQLLQYAVARLYAEDHGLTAEFPEWIGRELYGFDDPLLGPLLPTLSEKDVDIAGALSGRTAAALAEHDLWGYFQKSSQDFAGHRDRFRRMFKPARQIAALSAEWMSKLGAGDRPLVALHLRRGDFVKTKLWIAPEDWYLAWLGDLWPRLERPLLYIATDDPSVLTAFSAYAPVTTDILTPALSGAEFYPDFHVLTQATHLAISNSSFSFVAAMLNERGVEFVRPERDTARLVAFDPWNAPITLPQDPRLTEGEQLARQLLDAVPNHFPALIALAEILEQTDRRDEALQIYDKAIVANPRSAVAFLGRGKLLTRAGQPHEALAAFRTALELDPDNAKMREDVSRAMAAGPG